MHSVLRCRDFAKRRIASKRRWLFLLAISILPFFTADKSARVAFPPRFKKAGLLSSRTIRVSNTIVRLPNGVFNPYTSIKTNLLFFSKGKPTKEIGYYEHPYPVGYKSYSKTKPIRIEEFAAEKAWWDNREENEFAWKVSVEDIIANGYNLDIKNPYQEKEKHRDLGEMLQEYGELNAGLSEKRNLLKAELMEALEREGVEGVENY